MSCVYALCDPRSGEVRYVGKTTIPVFQRLRQHISAAERQSTRMAVHEWMRSLGEPPEVLVLARDPSNTDAAERWWISTFRLFDSRLLNKSAGGGPGRHTPETRAKMSATRTGRTKDAAWVEKFAAAQRGVKKGPYGPAHSEHIRKLHTGRKRSAETKRRLSEAAFRREARKRAERAAS